MVGSVDNNTQSIVPQRNDQPQPRKVQTQDSSQSKLVAGQSGASDSTQTQSKQVAPPPSNDSGGQQQAARGRGSVVDITV